jgi:ribosomal protein L22
MSKLLKKINDQVRQEILMGNQDLLEDVIQKQIAERLKKREGLIAQAIARLHSLDKELKKIKPDVEAGYDADGKEVKAASYTKKALESRKKLVEKIENLDKTLTEIIEFKPADVNDVKSDEVEKLNKLYEKLQKHVG